MERIQYAIAKARAERDARGETGAAPAAGADVRPREARRPAQPARPVPAPSRAEPPAPGPSEEEIMKAWRALPALRTTPRQAVRNRLVSLAGGTGSAEMDGIRTRLLQHMRARGARRVAITSPGPGCGKSTVTLNLGFSLGRQEDQRTIVADVDLRRPQMHKALGIREKHSFSTVLDGAGAFEANAVRHGQNLAFATNHGPARNPAELLQSRRAADALAAIEEIYQPTVMLFDLPPLLVNDDAMAFLGQMDCALIVAAAEKTTIKEIDRAERDVASQTFVLGVILNRCRYMDRADGYSEYYG